VDVRSTFAISAVLGRRDRRARGASNRAIHVGKCRVSPDRPKEVNVHAVVVRVTINDRESAQKGLNQDVVPGVSQAPGFRAGYWTWKDNTGLSMILFDSEDAANRAGDRIRAMVQGIDAVELEGVEVREVVAHA
jgi:hypothetical protein